MEERELGRLVQRIAATYVAGSVLNISAAGRPLLYPFFALALIPHVVTLKTFSPGGVAPPRVRGILTAIAVVVVACFATWLPVGPRSASVILGVAIVAVVVGLRLWADSMARWCGDRGWRPAEDFRRAIRRFDLALAALGATMATVVSFGPPVGDHGTIHPTEVLLGHSTRTGAVLAPALLFTAAMAVGHLRLRRAQRALRADLAADTPTTPSAPGSPRPAPDPA